MVYLLEDDAGIRMFTEYALNNSGFETKGFEKPSEFWAALETKVPKLLLLDLMLPEEDGLEVLQKLRSRRETKSLPVIILTAKSTEYDKVIGLDSGADDYISKPFGVMELISRVRALLRRTETDAGKEDEYTLGSLYVCLSKHEVRVGGESVLLTFKEFELLRLLVSNAGKAFSRNQILQDIWGIEFDGESRTVDVHIRSLRTKLGACGDKIETVRGLGYKINTEE